MLKFVGTKLLDISALLTHGDFILNLANLMKYNFISFYPCRGPQKLIETCRKFTTFII